MLEFYKYTQTEQKQLLDSLIILVDTREHEGKNDHILTFFDSKNISWKKKKLDYGDYSVAIPANSDLGIMRDMYFDKQIVIERKASLDEITNNLAQDRERLKREFALAPRNKIMIIENGSYADMVHGKYTSTYDAKSMFGTFHSFWHEFGLPIIFMPDKTYTGMFIHGYLQYYIRNLIK